MLTDAKRMELVERVWITGKISIEKKSHYCADNFREAVTCPRIFFILTQTAEAFGSLRWKIPKNPRTETGTRKGLVAEGNTA